MTTDTILLYGVTGITSVISVMLWINWMFLAGSLWYSHEAEVGSVEMRDEARICLTARACCLVKDMGRRGVTTLASLSQRCDFRSWSCRSVSRRRRSSAWGPRSTESAG